MKNLNASNARILIIDGGGRGHALGWKLRQDCVQTLFFAPGNAGTAKIGVNLPDLDLKNNHEILQCIIQYKIDLTIIGPEDPLARGLVDYLRANQQLVIGPTMKAARLETSKLFARKIMGHAKVPQPETQICYTADHANNAKEEMGLPLVLKVDGLAAGKGAYVCHDQADWEKAIKDIFAKKKFGSASDTVLVEECLIGEELSFFVLCDGLDYKIIGTAQDHKRLGEGDTGPNTGGMGAYSPTPFSTPEIQKEVENTIIQPILAAMNNLGCPVSGFMYPQIMLVKKDGKWRPYVIEINMRLGDPETQVILPLLYCNLFNLLWNAAQGKLAETSVSLADSFAATVVKTAAGYPGSYLKGDLITGLDNYFGEDRIIFQAGTIMGTIEEATDDEVFTNGGRVIAATGLGKTLAEAIEAAYDAIDGIHFKGEYCRRDIGQRGLKEMEKMQDD
ncbi:MAG: phosphoribosylamine--glycine ligase [Patescibacteria group bacterium]